MAPDQGPQVPDTPAQQIAERVFVIPDGRVPLVPNVGFVVGDHALLVIDTGMGIANGERVLGEARRLANGRDLYLTLTHFHPEHAFGAQVFADDATIIYNTSQAQELAEKGAEFIEIFRGFGPGVAAALEGVEFVGADITYSDSATVDLGGVLVDLTYHGHAHTHGDEVVYVRGQDVLFAGDLVENRLFPILPDDHAHGSLWIAVLERLEAMRPAIVVPGHGEVGDGGVIDSVREYLVDVRGRVAQRRAAGETLPAIQDDLGEAIRGDYASWDAEEWIAPAIERFFLERTDAD